MVLPCGNIVSERDGVIVEYYRAVIYVARTCYIRYNIPVRERQSAGDATLQTTPADIGKLIRETRKRLGVTQKQLALTAGTGLRFLIDLEKGKPTCEIGKALRILQTLGIKLTLMAPSGSREG